MKLNLALFQQTIFCTTDNEGSWLAEDVVTAFKFRVSRQQRLSITKARDELARQAYFYPSSPNAIPRERVLEKSLVVMAF